MSQPRFGLPIAALLGLVAGGYYLLLKFILRAVTQPFLDRARPFIPTTIKPLPLPWVSSEIDKL